MGFLNPKEWGKEPKATPILEPFKLAKPLFASWQLAQAVPAGSERLLSVKIFCPKFCRSLKGAGVAGVAAGLGALFGAGLKEGVGAGAGVCAALRPTKLSPKSALNSTQARFEGRALKEKFIREKFIRYTLV